MEIRQLRHFAAVVEAGNLSLAATRVFISQPALTRSIQTLEDRLGVVLLERRPRGIVPTLAGEAFYQRAKLILNECKRAKAEVSAIATGTGGELTVGIAALFATHIVDETVARYVEQRPNVRVTITEGFIEDLLRMLEDGRVDLIFANLPSVSTSTDLRIETLYTLSASVFASAGHKVAETSSPSLSALLDARWVSIDQPHMVGVLDQFFAAEDLPAPEPVVQTNSLPLMRALLNRGQFVALLTEELLAEDVAAGTVVRLDVPGTPLMRRAGLIQRPVAQSNPAAAPFIDLLRGICARQPPPSTDVSRAIQRSKVT